MSGDELAMGVWDQHKMWPEQMQGGRSGGCIMTSGWSRVRQADRQTPLIGSIDYAELRSTPSDRGSLLTFIVRTNNQLLNSPLAANCSAESKYLSWLVKHHHIYAVSKTCTSGFLL